MKNKLLAILILTSFLFSACNEADVDVENLRSTVTFVPFTETNDLNTKDISVNRDGSIQLFIDYMNISIINTNLGSDYEIEERYNFVDNGGENKISMDIYAGENNANFYTDQLVVSSDEPKENQVIDPSLQGEPNYNDTNDGDGLSCGSYLLGGITDEASELVDILRKADPYAPYEGSIQFTRGIDDISPVSVELNTKYGRVIATFEADDALKAANSTMQIKMTVTHDGGWASVVEDIEGEEYSGSTHGAWMYLSNRMGAGGNVCKFDAVVTVNPGTTAETSLTLTSTEHTIVAGVDQHLRFIISTDDIKKESFSYWDFVTPWYDDENGGEWN